MAQDSPQAINIPSFKDTANWIKDAVVAAKLDMDQQGLLDGASFPQIGAGPYLIPSDKTRVIGKRYIQNMSTAALLYKMVSPVSGDVVSVNNFNGVLAGGVAQDDGLGSAVDLSAVAGDISIMSKDGSNIRATLFQAYEPDLEGRTGQVINFIPPAG